MIATPFIDVSALTVSIGLFGPLVGAQLVYGHFCENLLLATGEHLASRPIFAL